MVLVTGCDDIEDHDLATIDVEFRKQGKPPQEPGAEQDDIAGHYMVLLKKGANPHAAAAAVAATPTHVFTDVFPGFAGKLNKGQRESLIRRSEVLLIEEDGIVTTAESECPAAFAAECPGPTTHYKNQDMRWGCDRTDQRDMPLSGSYTYTCAGTDVPVYIFDTGVLTSHPEFADPSGARAHVAYDALGGNGQDCNGHGTHVAGIVGGKTYGIAKQAELYSVRVLGCNGSGTWSNLIAAMDWVAKHGEKPAIANMSLGGFYSYMVNVGVNNLAGSGVTVVVAAGNNGGDACWRSPASASRALTVGATNSNDTWASYSNRGSCVDILAGGTNIKSAWLANGTKIISGTSMATPHVAGVAALYLQANGLDNVSINQIEQDLEAWASRDKISGVPTNTANRLLYWPCASED